MPWTPGGAAGFIRQAFGLARAVDCRQAWPRARTAGDEMTFETLDVPPQSVEVLRRSLDRGRLAHAWLLTGARLEPLTGLARALAAALMCQQPPRTGASGLPLDACGQCAACRLVAADEHPDVHWLRPESKMRQIRVEQLRGLMREFQMKSRAGGWKVAVLVGADRMNANAANAFLKTLEEPPPRSVLLLLSTEPDRLLETIRSRCLRLDLGSEEGPVLDEAQRAWLAEFAQAAGAAEDDLMARYRLLERLLAELRNIKEQVREELEAASPLAHHRGGEDVEPELREQWEKELVAAVEGEYRHRRSRFLDALVWWLRDIWLATLDMPEPLWAVPELKEATRRVAARLSPEQARQNLEGFQETLRLLHTNIPEAFNLEVGLLNLHL
ncbi:MAG: hypothetical protein D6766_00145 [Verrucomicrobia bacterium]|nr:MAG: hypothetical protein D6766_00145 [Verrucomicrobiota bacterium]